MVELPYVRSSVIEILRDLADPEFQQRVWVEKRGDPNLIETLRQTVSDLFDLYLDDKDIGGSVGVVLENQAEARAIEKLSRALLPLYESLPVTEPFTDEREAASALSMPGWTTVVECAGNALELMSDD